MKLLSRKRKVEFTPEEQAIIAKPWVNNFGPIEFYDCNQSDENQRKQFARQGHIFRHIRDALARYETKPRGIMCTVSDGFYGLYALHKGASHIDIVDVGGHIPNREDWHLEQTRLAARALGMEDRATFATKNLFEIEGKYDFGIFVSALPNFPNPAEVMKHLWHLIDGPLVFQCNTAVLNNFTLTPKAERWKPGWDPDEIDQFFYESPCEILPWGSAFGRRKLIEMIVDAGWTIVNENSSPQPEDGTRYGLRENMLCV